MPFFRTLLRPLARQPWWPRPGTGTELGALLDSADASAPLVERHLWLIRVIDWVRCGEPHSGTAYVMRLLAQDPARRARVVALLAAFWRDMDVAALLADYGFSPRSAFLNELGERLRRRALPPSPDTADLAQLFNLLFDDPTDVDWVSALDASLLADLAQLWREALAHELACGSGPGTASASPLGWREPFFDAMAYLASQVRAAGLSPAFRSRLGTRVDDEVASDSAPAESGGRTAFRQLSHVTERLHELALGHLTTQAALAQAHGEAEPPVWPAALLQEAQYLRALLAECAQAASGLHGHLEVQGISVDLVFQIDQLCERCRRIETLLDAVLSPTPVAEWHQLLSSLLTVGEARRSVRALFAQHYSMLARKVAERSAETGEHYITRNRAEYADMLARAAGGGAVIAGTTFMKFAVLSLALSPFWAGLGAGLNYAVSFVIVQLLHWTVATKQPAMTAPALAARLADTRHEEAIEGFVDEVAHLIRSQMAGILGNLALVAPLVLGVQALSWWLRGAPVVGEHEAHHVLETLTLLGPTAWYAAFTGVLLFASSLIAGWVENWFVLHRLDSALQWNPRIRAWLGAERAAHWAGWWRGNISGLAANVSLGLLLGLVPVIAGFMALPLDVRHVTLSTGQLMAAAGALGPAILHDPHWWWCVAAIPVTGALNVGVSFALALRVAVRSRGVKGAERGRLWAAVRQRLWRQPLSFLLPPRDPA
ncbi:site-specific recombinase [Aquabacterium sp.]|uniref:site-specific recombinase n=1 Tax=Aquabacterium sp. TaxID=1872578 RepID=UPI0025BAA5AC|nr:site-specific recombinase [Aquabacterium sp.]